jgi:hypothetical protein
LATGERSLVKLVLGVRIHAANVARKRERKQPLLIDQRPTSLTVGAEQVLDATKVKLTDISAPFVPSPATPARLIRALDNRHENSSPKSRVLLGELRGAVANAVFWRRLDLDGNSLFDFYLLERLDVRV